MKGLAMAVVFFCIAGCSATPEQGVRGAGAPYSADTLTPDELASKKYEELYSKKLTQCADSTATSDPQCKDLNEQMDRLAHPDLAVIAQGGDPCQHFLGRDDQDVCHSCSPATPEQALACVKEYWTASKNWENASTDAMMTCFNFRDNRAQLRCPVAREEETHANFLEHCIAEGVGKARCDARWAADPSAAKAEVRARIQVQAEDNQQAESGNAQLDEQAQQIKEQQSELDEQGEQIREQQLQIENAEWRARDAENMADWMMTNH